MPGAIPELDELGPKVVDPRALYSLREEMRTLLERDKASFPGAQPVSLLKRHFEELCNHDFFVCEKSDGMRCLMLMSTMDPQHGDFRPATYLVDRKNNYYYIPGLGFPKPRLDSRTGKTTGYIPGTYHRDTVLDGEIVLDIDEDRGKRQLKFLVFDALIVDKKNLLHRNLSTRLGYAKEWIHTPYKAMLKTEPKFFEEVPFIVEAKHMEFAYGIEDLFRIHLPNLKHGNDGLIFTSLEGEYVCGTDPYILKWKPDDENSIDFRLNLVFPPSSSTHLSPYTVTTQTPYTTIPSGTIFQLSIWKGGGGPDSYLPWGDMYVTDSDWTKIKTASDVEVPLENAIVECRWDKSVGTEGRWRFMRFRTDKENANFVDVAKNVRESIEDGVSKEELLSWAVGIKAGWRTRHPKKN